MADQKNTKVVDIEVKEVKEANEQKKLGFIGKVRCGEYKQVNNFVDGVFRGVGLGLGMLIVQGASGLIKGCRNKSEDNDITEDQAE